jgi:hypothetical protein
MIDIDKIEAAAKAATPGPWVMECGDDPENWSRYFPTVGAADIEIVGTEGFYCGERDVDIANADHIATANPATVLEMVSMIRERDAQVVQLQEQNTMLDAKLSEVEAVLRQALSAFEPSKGDSREKYAAIAAIKGVLEP